MKKQYYKTDAVTFRNHMKYVEEQGNLLHFTDGECKGIAFYLDHDLLSGYGITADQEIVNLFSLVRGLGTKALNDAVQHGGNWLNCFDTLTQYYIDRGFVEYDREANWTSGKPDVVWMRLKHS